MQSLIVYDSWYGNTRKIAEAIADGLPGEVEVVRADNDPNRHLLGCTLLIVGSPTHGGAATPAVQEFLNSINMNGLDGITVAAFDTRSNLKLLQLIGFAAQNIAKQLQQKGGRLVVKPEGFYVKTKTGPLIEDEIARAQRWAADLAQQLEETWHPKGENHNPVTLNSRTSKE